MPEHAVRNIGLIPPVGQLHSVLFAQALQEAGELLQIDQGIARIVRQMHPGQVARDVRKCFTWNI
jgi:hypothetical protein